MTPRTDFVLPRDCDTTFLPDGEQLGEKTFSHDRQKHQSSRIPARGSTEQRGLLIGPLTQFEKADPAIPQAEAWFAAKTPQNFFPEKIPIE
jgi:hypothetical protein